MSAHLKERPTRASFVRLRGHRKYKARDARSGALTLGDRGGGVRECVSHIEMGQYKSPTKGPLSCIGEQETGVQSRFHVAPFASSALSHSFPALLKQLEDPIEQFPLLLLMQMFLKLIFFPLLLTTPSSTLFCGARLPNKRGEFVEGFFFCAWGPCRNLLCMDAS